MFIIRELRQQSFPLSDLLAMVGVARSTYYYHAKVELTETPESDSLMQEITVLFAQHKGCYGYRRITLLLRQMSKLVNKKRIQRLMAKQGLCAVVRRRRRYSSYQGEQGRIAANVLARQFESVQANEKWVTDVTEFKVGEDKLYLSPLMDLYNREIVSYTLKRRPTYDLVAEMMSQALAQLPENASPLVHSDQGWHYQHPTYQHTLAQRGLTQSMLRKGNCLDNAVIENFFGTLKCEMFYIEKFTSIEQLEQRIREYIHYYNHERIHTKLKGLPPVQYRLQSSNTTS